VVEVTIGEAAVARVEKLIYLELIIQATRHINEDIACRINAGWEKKNGGTLA